jgi:DNA-binding response OmpR family regulator
VEDEPAFLNLTRRMLEQLGYAVLTAGTPGEALVIAREHRGSLDLLLTDVVMPELNGRELATSLRASRPGLKRLFMSGYTADMIAHQGVVDEGLDFIQKPFSSRALAAKVREVLAGSGSARR